MKKRVVLVILAVVILSAVVLSAASEKSYEGKLLEIKGIWFIKTADTVYGLDLDKIDSAELEKNPLVKGNTVVVKGEISDDVLSVTYLKSNSFEYSIVAEETSDYIGYHVNTNKCISCKLCVKNCPVGAISMVNGKAVIDTDKCISCGICKNGNGQSFNGCPVGAIDNK